MPEEERCGAGLRRNGPSEGRARAARRGSGAAWLARETSVDGSPWSEPGNGNLLPSGDPGTQDGGGRRTANGHFGSGPLAARRWSWG